MILTLIIIWLIGSVITYFVSTNYYYGTYGDYLGVLQEDIIFCASMAVLGSWLSLVSFYIAIFSRKTDWPQKMKHNKYELILKPKQPFKSID